MPSTLLGMTRRGAACARGAFRSSATASSRHRRRILRNPFFRSASLCARAATAPNQATRYLVVLLLTRKTWTLCRFDDDTATVATAVLNKHCPIQPFCCPFGPSLHIPLTKQAPCSSDLSRPSGREIAITQSECYSDGFVAVVIVSTAEW